MEFPRTRWTLILAARGQPEQRRRLLAELLQSYWKPLYLTLRARGFAQAPAEDAVQGFALTLLEKDALERLDPGKGRLRAYLKTALLHYVASEHARDSAQKRGGAQRPIALEVTELESASSTHLDPELEYQRAWARQVMERALAALRGEYSSGARAGPVELLELLPQPATAIAATNATALTAR